MDSTNYLQPFLRVLHVFRSTLSLSTSRKASKSFTLWSGHTLRLSWGTSFAFKSEQFSCLSWVPAYLQIAKLWKPVSREVHAQYISVLEIQYSENCRPMLHQISIFIEANQQLWQADVFLIVIAVTFKTDIVSWRIKTMIAK